MTKNFEPKVLKKFYIDTWKWLVCKDEYGIYLLSRHDGGYWQHSEIFDDVESAVAWAKRFECLLSNGDTVWGGGCYVGTPLYVRQAKLYGTEKYLKEYGL